MAHVYTMVFLNGDHMRRGESNDYTLDMHGNVVFNFSLRERDTVVVHTFEDGLLVKIVEYVYDGENLVFQSEDPPVECPPSRTIWERVAEGADEPEPSHR